MTSRFPGLLCIVLLLACCGGCASTRIPADLFDEQANVTAPDPSFESGIQLLTAANDARASTLREANDWVLLGVKVTRNGRTDVWFVRVSELPADVNRYRAFIMPLTVGPVPAKSMLISRVGRACIEVFDQNCVSVHTSIVPIPTGTACASLLDLCNELSPTRPVPPVDGASPVHTEALATLVILLKAVVQSHALKSVGEAIKADVIEMPGVLSFLMAGFRLNAEVALKAMASTPSARLMHFNALCDEVQLQLRVAGQPMINGRMICRSPEPPFHLTGGMLLLEAVHPVKPRNRMMVCVLASRRK